MLLYYILFNEYDMLSYFSFLIFRIIKIIICIYSLVFLWLIIIIIKLFNNSNNNNHHHQQ